MRKALYTKETKETKNFVMRPGKSESTSVSEKCSGRPLACQFGRHPAARGGQDALSPAGGTPAATAAAPPHDFRNRFLDTRRQDSFDASLAASVDFSCAEDGEIPRVGLMRAHHCRAV